MLQVFDHAMKYYLRVLVDTKASAAYNALDSKDDVFNITTIEELAEVGPTDLGDKPSSVLKGPDGKWHADYLPSEESMRKKLPGKTNRQLADIQSTTCYACHARTTLECELCSAPICEEHSRGFAYDYERWFEIVSRICLPCEADDRLEHQHACHDAL